MATLLLVIIYIAFISLGLPDALLGSSWPIMQQDLNAPFAMAGAIQMVVSIGTILSSMFSGVVIRKFGTGKLTAISVALTAIGLLGISFATHVAWLFVLAIPLGFGAGAVDSGLNSYVASHYESRHMSWLHSFWGLGALMGPLILSFLLRSGATWRSSYGSIGIFQVALVVILVASIPLWNRVKTRSGVEEEEEHSTLTLLSSLKIKGVPYALLVFLLYCGIEVSMGLWGGSYLVKVKGLTVANAATWVSLYFGGITLGRFITGFLTFKFHNNTICKFGMYILAIGILFLMLPLPLPLSLSGFILIGLGCAPIFPSMIHETPKRFGKFHSQVIIGFQMGTAYIGILVLPPMFGLISQFSGVQLLPLFLIAYNVFMYLSFIRLLNIVKTKNNIESR